MSYRRIVLGVVLLACATIGQAETVLYQDDFSGSSGTTLNGQSPDVAYGSLSGGTWTASSAFTAGGSAASPTGTAAAYLSKGVAVESDKVYTLSLDMNASTYATSGSASWAALGYLTNGTTSTSANLLSNVKSIGLIELRPDKDHTTTSGLKTFGGYANTPADSLNRYINDTTTDVQNFKVVLNTSGSDWKSWKFSWHVGDTSYGSTTLASTTIDAAPANLWVTFGVSRYFSGSVDNLKLTVAPVPEPGTLTLAMCGLVGLVAYAWRKRK